MATLAPSLVRLRAEIDDRWPNRDRRTDGWYADPRIRISYGHNPDARGRVHAIDVDRDGINPDWIIDHIHRSGTGLWYIIWNRRLWSMTHGWVPYAYHGPSPHTDHTHIEIRHTDAAFYYAGAWGIAAEGQGTIGTVPPPANQWGTADPLSEIIASANHLQGAGDLTYGYGSAIADLRNT